MGRLFFVLATCCPLIASSQVDSPAEKRDAMIGGAVEDARSHGRTWAFQRIAEMGTEVAGLGEQLAGLVEDPDPNVRLGACLALGHLERVDLAATLAAALESADWRVTFAACQGLARLKAGSALPSLENTRDHHWYPRVRRAARIAIDIVKEKSPIEDRELLIRDPRKGPPADFFNSTSEDLHALPLKPNIVAKLGVVVPNAKFIPWDRENESSTSLKTFQDLHPQFHAAISKINPKGMNGTWLYDCHMSGLITREGVTFIALDAGEWVGGLFAIPGDGMATALLDENVSSLIEWDGKLLAFSGISHMGMEHGDIHAIHKKDGAWIASWLYSLPGNPQDSGILPDGRLFVNCGGGAVAISREGRFEYLGSGKGTANE